MSNEAGEWDSMVKPFVRRTGGSAQLHKDRVEKVSVEYGHSGLRGFGRDKITVDRKVSTGKALSEEVAEREKRKD